MRIETQRRKLNAGREALGVIIAEEVPLGRNSRILLSFTLGMVRLDTLLVHLSLTL